MLLILYDPFGHYLIIILPLFSLCIITGIISLDILNPPLDRETTFSLCKEFNKALPRASRKDTRPRIISFPLDNLINFFKEYTQRFKEKVTRPKEKDL